MGNIPGFSRTFAIPSDVRIDRCIRNFNLPQQKLQVLWKIFTLHDTSGEGLLQFETLCGSVLKYPRNPITDAIPTFFDTKQDASITFGEFVEIICTFACFEQWDLLKYMFIIMDSNRCGLVEKHELKLFLYRIWNNRPYDNVERALTFLQEIDEDGSFAFNEVVQLRDLFPQIFYPLYQFQVHVMTYSLGELWWETHKFLIKEQRKLQQEQAIKQLALQEKEKQQALSLVSDDMLKRKMGVFYYLTPWNIKKERARMLKIAAMEQDLEEDYMQHQVQRGFVSKESKESF